MIPRTGSSPGSSTPPANVPRQEPPAPSAQAAQPGPLSNRRVPAERGARPVRRTALEKGKAPVSSTSGAASPVSLPREPVAVLRERVAGLKQLATQRAALLPAPPSADRRGGAAMPAGPSDNEIARLSDAVRQLLTKSEGLARDVLQAQRDLDQQESQLANAARVPEQRAGTATQGATAQGRPARSAPVVVPVPEALSPEAEALQKAQRQLDEAGRKQGDAEARFNAAKAATEQKRQSALDLAAKRSGHAEWATTYDGLLNGMANKITVDSDEALTQLGLPPVQARSTPYGQKDSLQREFRAYRAGLTECGPGGRWQFRSSVKAGLPKLMAFDALVRTHAAVVINPLGITACHEYRESHPQVPAPSLEAAEVMAKLALDNVAGGLSVIPTEAAAAASGRQKADKRAREVGLSASEAKAVGELRMKDMGGVGERARRLLELLEDNRRELQQTLTDFMYAGLVAVPSERDRFLREAAAARQQADAKDPEFAARMMELFQARKAFQEAKARVKELLPPQRDPPGPSAAAAPSAAATAIPQMPSAPPGPGLARDPETRRAKQRGRKQRLEDLRDGARQHLVDVSTALRGAEAALQKAREALDDAVIRRDQADQVNRQNWAQQRDEQATRRQELKVLDAEIEAARAGLRADPALRSLIDPQALQRVIKCHLDLDDEALRRRALEKTGLNGRYDSVEHMAEAVADVHVAALARFPQLFAARTPAEFEQAAQAHPAYDATLKALVNIPHEHNRLVGQGYDAKIDRTERLIPLTRSEYGVAWCGDRVRVSHLHPGVPRRVLRTLDRPPRNPE